MACVNTRHDGGFLGLLMADAAEFKVSVPHDTVYRVLYHRQGVDSQFLGTFSIFTTYVVACTVILNIFPLRRFLWAAQNPTFVVLSA